MRSESWLHHLLPGCGNLGKSPNLSEAQAPHCETGVLSSLQFAVSLGRDNVWGDVLASAWLSA